MHGPGELNLLSSGLPGGLPLALPLGAGELSVGTIVGAITVGWALSVGLLIWRRWAGVIGAGLMGLGVSIYLGIQHHPAMGSSACSVGAFDCDAVNRSEYSEILGVPIAFLGTLFYAGLVALAVMTLRKPEAHQRAPALVFGGGLAAVAYSLFLAWASTQVGSWCLFCISLYGVNLLIAVAGYLLRKGQEESLGKALVQSFMANGERSFSSFSTAGVLVFVACMVFYDRIETVEEQAESSGDLAMLFEATYGPMTLDGSEPIKGDPQAPYTLVEFADLQCPSCGAVFPELEKLVKEVPQIRVLYKHYPISSICNDKVEGERHHLACNAAAASECARNQGRFWELTRLMFINQRTLEKEDIRFMAEQVGLELDAFETCMADPATSEAVKKDVAHAHEVGVYATPSLFLQGLNGEEWVHVHGGPEAAALLVKAHLRGDTLPATPPAGSHGH